LDVAAIDPTQFLQRLPERADPGLIVRIVRACGQKYADTPHPLGLLRTCRERPRGCRAAEKRDELAPLHARPSEHALGNVQSLALCDWAAREKWHTTGLRC
jgi:hypothetical protein